MKNPLKNLFSDDPESNDNEFGKRHYDDMYEGINNNAEDESQDMGIPIGDRLVHLLEVAYRARRNVLLEGVTGIGKSDVVEQFAAKVGINVTVLDLSLFEPPDLIGLPIIKGDRSHYAAPAILPIEGNGVLMLEELNRAEIPVMQPALQLLSARRLHNYILPEGWFCIASINPDDGDYQVYDLDPALRSRFLQVSVHADREAWLSWADQAHIHPIIQQTVQQHYDALIHAPPRSWAYASELLQVLKPHECRNEMLLESLLKGYLPPAWALVVTRAIMEAPESLPIDLDFLLDPQAVPRLTEMIQTQLCEGGRTDIVHAAANRLCWLYGSGKFRDSVKNKEVHLENMEKLASIFPGDVRDQCLDVLAKSPAAEDLLRDLGYDIMQSFFNASDNEKDALLNEIRQWNDDGQKHRVDLVFKCTLRALRLLGTKELMSSSGIRFLKSLIELGGKVNSLTTKELKRALSARGIYDEWIELE